tara:strand:+ start:81 stop:452 length:372 start_codon:yes stop_codon:yes gene_type:complete
MSEKKPEATFAVETKTLEKNILSCVEKRYKLVSLLEQYITDKGNPYQMAIVDLLCEEVSNIKYMLAQINFIVDQSEVYKDEERGIQGFKVSLEVYTMMKNYMAINLLCETDLLNDHNISLQLC